jgi:hypothetical protein
MENSAIPLLSELQKKLVSTNAIPTGEKIFVGFDGFVDTIQKAVKQKQNYKTLYFETIQEFAERIKETTGKSGQIEMVTEKIKLGGNAPILSNTLGKLGISSYCLGSMGFPEIDPVFKIMNTTTCEVISVLNPGRSSAVEFSDGKIIFSELSIFDNYDWEYVKHTAGVEKIRKAVMDSSILCFVDWVNLPHASGIWEGILDDIIKPSGKKDFLFFFDLCDPSKKTTEQIDEVLDLMSSFSPYGKVTLGLNENETLKIWCSIRGVKDYDSVERCKIPPVREAGDAIYKAMNIDSLLVHPVDRTIVYHHRETVELQGRLVRKPKVLTGGGDNLNAGYCLGMLSGLSIPQCMLLGMAASGAYIENGTSPDVKALIDYISVWMDDLSKKGEEPTRVVMHKHQ